MWNKAKQFWASLPHPVQAILLSTATAAGTAFIHALSEGNCYSAECLKRYAASAVGAGLIAAKAFYMTPNRPQLPAQNPAPPAAQ